MGKSSESRCQAIKPWRDETLKHRWLNQVYHKEADPHWKWSYAIHACTKTKVIHLAKQGADFPVLFCNPHSNGINISEEHGSLTQAWSQRGESRRIIVVPSLSRVRITYGWNVTGAQGQMQRGCRGSVASRFQTVPWEQQPESFFKFSNHVRILRPPSPPPLPTAAVVPTIYCSSKWRIEWVEGEEYALNEEDCQGGGRDSYLIWGFKSPQMLLLHLPILVGTWESWEWDAVTPTAPVAAFIPPLTKSCTHPCRCWNEM